MDKERLKKGIKKDQLPALLFLIIVDDGWDENMMQDNLQF
jgi:hypothetical protein